MISIIVSKYHSSQIEILKNNIERTIGVPYELIVIENGEGRMGLCEVYNNAARKARYETLCYTHEDVAFETMNWGLKVIDLFNGNKKLGLLGVAGSGFKSLSPSGWWYPCADHQTVFTNYLQSNKDQVKADLQYSNPGNKRLSAVVCVDGFWFCTLKHIALQIKFDQDAFKGFHCYDIDFSLSVFPHYEVAVSFDILIKHFSEGTLNKQWITDTLTLYEKWRHALPVNVVNLDHAALVREEIKALDYFLTVSLENNISLKQAFGVLWSNRLRSLLGLKTYLKQHLKLVKKAITVRR